ncbi:MAG TPA: ribosome maturation factor RimP [Oscillospiraceae bacterium]|nr:ribosome maturation factor RimP [Oscillospiraceae bacterium]HPK35183.1 ribosome maturation factor RimP [Oscillospiraceae bacterium]HPR74986.1 ribosome maturation factor RimP [Oscillospiraceae bacterium]
MGKNIATARVAVTVRELMEPVAKQCGVSIWDVEYLKEGGNFVLRVTIDRAEGIDTDLCYQFTELANPVIDEADPINGSYCFEVSSPGLDRKLRLPEHFTASIGREVELRTIRPVDGRRDFTGILTGFSDGVISLETDGEEKLFPLRETAYTKWRFTL